MIEKIEKSKNIIFDLGAVIININPEKVKQLLKEIMPIEFDNKYEALQKSGIFEAYEINEISSKQFIKRVEKIFDNKISESQIESIWNEMLLDIPARRIEILIEQKHKKNTFLCSNTNEIHINTIRRYLKNSFFIDGLKPLFNKVYLSYELGIRKPNPKIFELILDENNLKAEETLFIDDSAEHIDSAASLGINTIHLTADITLEKLFEV